MQYTSPDLTYPAYRRYLPDPNTAPASNRCAWFWIPVSVSVAIFSRLRFVCLFSLQLPLGEVDLSVAGCGTEAKELSGKEDIAKSEQASQIFQRTIPTKLCICQASRILIISIEMTRPQRSFKGLQDRPNGPLRC